MPMRIVEDKVDDDDDVEGWIDEGEGAVVKRVFRTGEANGLIRTLLLNLL